MLVLRLPAASLEPDCVSDYRHRSDSSCGRVEFRPSSRVSSGHLLLRRRRGPRLLARLRRAGDVFYCTSRHLWPRQTGNPALSPTYCGRHRMKPVFDSFSEPRTDRRKFLLGLLFCSAAGIAQWRRPYKTLDYLGRNKLDDLVPKKIGPWNFVAASGLVLPPDDPYLNSIYSQLLTRVYSDGQNPPIMLLLAQSGSQTGFLQIHRPETCYTAGGYQISPLAPHAVQVGTKV